MNIRAAVPEDASALLEIYAPYVEQTAISFEYTVPDEAAFAARIAHTLERYPWLVAQEDGELLGYACAGPFKSREAYDWSVETTIYVRRDRRRGGVGRALYGALEEALTAQGIQNANACIASPEVEDETLTRDSIRFHERMGYRLVGEFSACGCKFGRWYNMLWMEKHLGPHPAAPAAVRPFPAVRDGLAEKWAGSPSASFEQEFKWNADERLQERVLAWALERGGTVRTIAMDAAYFDTPDGVLSAEKTALRLRWENDECVCCLKMRGAEQVSGGLHAHAEYECAAETLAEGLRRLPLAGAPEALCARLSGLPLAETCRIAFERRAVSLAFDEAEAELALDCGTLASGGRRAPLCEIELERKSGSEAAFLRFGRLLADKFALEPQSLSKLARAKAL